MQLHFGWIIISCVLLVGCDKSATKTAGTPKSSAKDKGAATSDGAADLLNTATDNADKRDETAKSTPLTAKDDSDSTVAAAAGSAPIAGGVAKLTPENTKIVFVGTHVGPKPDPRTGGFEKFKGEATVDPQDKTLKSVTVEIDTSSLWTQIDNLTRHLNSPDFFDTREHPVAKFVSTGVAPGQDAGAVAITGDLTLLATTKEITVPATISVDDRGLSLKADFKIDRSEFGMDRLLDRVEKPVALTVVIGEKTEPLPAAGR